MAALRRAGFGGVLAAAACASALACGPSRSELERGREARGEATSADEAEVVPAPEALGQTPGGAALDDAALDAMDRAALEAACYEGSSAACDRLGH